MNDVNPALARPRCRWSTAEFLTVSRAQKGGKDAFFYPDRKIKKFRRDDSGFNGRIKCFAQGGASAAAGAWDAG